MPTHELRVRSLVRLRDNSGIMVVEKVTATHALCVWYRGTEKVQYVFNVNSLSLVRR